MDESKELEREAIALLKQYGFLLPAAVRGFMRRLAVHLKWDELQRVMR
ncbi:MAG TPA: hypothetical protein VEC35_23370 [Noviherbaspirillum sp.]|nr:hypothetical protein [Noviherbaspirillum sp.]